MFAVVVTGPPGAGKTVCLTALSDALVEDEIAHAAVDVDDVSWAFPFLEDGQRCEHLRSWGELHRHAGHDLFLVAEVIGSAGHLADVLSAVGADDHLIVRLEARLPTLRRRIVAREPPGWSELDWLLADTERSLVALAGLDDVHLVLDTERLEPRQAVERIRAARPDRLAPPG